MNLEELAHNVAVAFLEKTAAATAVAPAAPAAPAPAVASQPSSDPRKEWVRRNLTHLLPAEEKAKIYAEDAKRFAPNTPARRKKPKTTKEKFIRNARSLGRGLRDAGKITLARTGESLVDLAAWLPELGDRLVFGNMLGVDNGRGLIGGKMARFHRYVDGKVDSMRHQAENAEYYDRSDATGIGRFNRFMRGSGADALGSFIGFGGLQGMASRGIGRIIGPTLGAGFSLHGTFDRNGRLRQLREREEAARMIGPHGRRYIDVTSTKANQEDAYTPEEYMRYHIPEDNLPASWSGRVHIPYSWLHTSGGAPIQFREYGT